MVHYERRLLGGLFATRDAVTLSELKGTFRGSLKDAQHDLYRASVKRRWFAADPSRVRAEWSRNGLLVIALGAVAAIPLGTLLGAGWVGVAAVLVGLVTLLWSDAMPRRTATGRELLRRILGFRRYMETAETERQRFAERENIFAAYLPYAIVFGLVTKWAHAFSDLDAQQAAAGWYIGSSLDDTGALSSDLASFSATLGDVVSVVSSSASSGDGSSGFDGGGFSGGGGGGGGGGRW